MIKKGNKKMNNKRILETFKKDNCLVDIIYQHKGKENAIGTQELVCALTESGYSVKADSIHTIVKRVVLERHLPICALTQHGYYWAISKQDLQNCIDELQDKINGLQERIDLLKSFICE